MTELWTYSECIGRCSIFGGDLDVGALHGERSVRLLGCGVCAMQETYLFNPTVSRYWTIVNNTLDFELRRYRGVGAGGNPSQ